MHTRLAVAAETVSSAGVARFRVIGFHASSIGAPDTVGVESLCGAAAYVLMTAFVLTADTVALGVIPLAPTDTWR